MGARNMVIAGDYVGKGLMTVFQSAQIALSFKQSIELNSATVEHYEVVTEEQCKSAASGVARGLIGGALLGPVGLLAGGMSAKNKGAYTLAIQFKDGKKSLIEVDEKIYKAIMTSCF